MSDIEAQRAARRAAMPVTRSFLEEYAEFSPKVIWAKERGISAGKQPHYTEVFNIPPGYGMSTNVAKVKK